MTLRTSFPRRSTQSPMKKQGGFTLQDFIFWAIIASLMFLVLIGIYTKGMAMYRGMVTTSDVTQIKAAVEDWRGGRTDVSGVDMSKLCADGNGNKNASWCGSAQDGAKANAYGGDYTVTVSSNVSQVDIAITGIDSEYINTQGNRLAPMSADRCASIDSCSTVTATGTTVTVTM